MKNGFRFLFGSEPILGYSSMIWMTVIQGKISIEQAICSRNLDFLTKAKIDAKKG
jgi:hypothetical protein